MKRFLNLKWASILVVAIVIVTVAFARVVEVTKPAEPTEDVDQIRQRTGVPVEVVVVEEAPFELRRNFTGSVRGIRSATVRAITEDQILEILVRVGQPVLEDAVLVRQSSRGSMSAVNQADAAYNQALRTVDRLRPVYEQGAISEQNWDEALTGLRVAELNLETAQRAIVLTSPISGIVTDVLVTSGTFPGAGDPLVRISDLSRMQVLLKVSPGQRKELALGQPAFLSGSEIRGEVTRIALQADPESRLLEVEITFPESGLLLPGALSTVEIVVLEKESTIAVPNIAVRDGGVWVVDEEGAAHRLAVEAGLRSENQVEILSGLRPGARMVVAGASLLTEGVQTRIVGG